MTGVVGPAAVPAGEGANLVLVGSGDRPVPALAMTILEWLGERLLNLATTSESGHGRTLYARTITAWATREVGDDPAGVVDPDPASGVLTGGTVDLDTLAMVVRASLEQQDPTAPQ